MQPVSKQLICKHAYNNMDIVGNSTVALRVVGGDKKGCIESETVKYPMGLGPENDCAGEGQQQL
jgi:hypothetical protein